MGQPSWTTEKLHKHKGGGKQLELWGSGRLREEGDPRMFLVENRYSRNTNCYKTLSSK